MAAGDEVPGAPSRPAASAGGPPRGDGRVRPAERYGDRPRRTGRRRGAWVVAALAAVLALAFIVWTAWDVANPDVRAVMTSFDEDGDRALEARLEVVKDADATVVCRVRALGAERGTVGSAEAVLAPPEFGAVSRIVLRVPTTEPPASAELLGCTVLEP